MWKGVVVLLRDEREKGVAIIIFCFIFFHRFYFPAQRVGGFTLSDLLDKPWSQVSSLLPPGIHCFEKETKGFGYILLRDEREYS